MNGRKSGLFRLEGLTCSPCGGLGPATFCRFYSGPHRFLFERVAHIGLPALGIVPELLAGLLQQTVSRSSGCGGLEDMGLPRFEARHAERPLSPRCRKNFSRSARRHIGRRDRSLVRDQQKDCQVLGRADHGTARRRLFRTEWLRHEDSTLDAYHREAMSAAPTC